MAARQETGSFKYLDILETVKAFGGFRQDITRIVYLEAKHQEYINHGNR